jgi:hypothetical protein
MPAQPPQRCEDDIMGMYEADCMDAGYQNRVYRSPVRYRRPAALGRYLPIGTSIAQIRDCGV